MGLGIIMKNIIKKSVLFFVLFALFIPETISAMPIFDRNGRVMILTYHKVSELAYEWSDYCVSPKVLEEDIKYLKNLGYTFMTASELASADTKGKKIAVLTFDDGYESDYKYVMPLLEKYGVCATFFVIGGALGTPEYMTKQQLSELSKKSFAEIGSHSNKLHFKNYSTLVIMYRSNKYNAEIIKDFSDNVAVIKEITGKTPAAVSYPNGIYSPEIDKILKAGGKKITFTTKETRFAGVKQNSAVGRRNRSCHKDIKNMEKSQ